MLWWLPTLFDSTASVMVWFAIAQLLVVVFFPALAIFLAHRFKVIALLGPVVLCYLCGMGIRNLDLLPIQAQLAMTLAEITVPLAIPMLLFSTDFLRWARLAGKTILSFGLMVIAVLTSASVAYWLLGAQVPEAHKVSGMLIGMYTGGGPNMSAIGLALGVKHELYVLVNATDVMLGGAYLMFLLTFAHRFCLLFLPPFPKDPNATNDDATEASITKSIPLASRIRNVTLAFLLSAVILAAGFGLSLLIAGKASVTVIMLTITTLGLAGSFWPRIRNLHGSYEGGDYLLLIFCVSIGTITDLQQVAQAGSGVLLYTAAVMFGALALHFLGAYLLRIDADTALITSTAGIYGPVFIGPVASAMHNREIVVSGLTTGLIGYAIGTYLGILLPYLLHG